MRARPRRQDHVSTFNSCRTGSQGRVSALRAGHDSSTGDSRHVGGGVDGLGEVLDLDLESGLDGLEDLAVGVRGDERDGQSSGSESSGSSDSVEVRVGVGRLVVVDDNVDSLDVDSSSKDVGADKDSLLERLELLVPLNSAGRERRQSAHEKEGCEEGEGPNAPLVLGETRVDADGREVALLEQLVELGSSRNRLDKDADLRI